MKVALVTGAGGFIGSHLVRRLKGEGYRVIGADIKYPEFSTTVADEFILTDLRYLQNVDAVCGHGVNEIYQLAADMGGAGYIFTKEHDADIVHNSGMINLNIAKRAVEVKADKVFFSSSACVYADYNQTDPNNPNCSEEDTYPANPDSAYGWEKLFSERLYNAFERNYNVDVRIARFHNIYGPEGTWKGGREKAPAALCRKVAEAEDGGYIEVWGDGEQTRSFLYIDECIEGMRRLMSAHISFEPLNVGSEEMVTINALAEMIIKISGKKLEIKHVEGSTGVRGRCSDNKWILKRLGWAPDYPLKAGLEKTYDWVNKQVHGE